MNTDELATKFAKKLGFGPAKNKDATAARLTSAQRKKAFEEFVIPFLREVGEISWLHQPGVKGVCARGPWVARQ